jgi:hypothetical protein
MAWLYHSRLDIRLAMLLVVILGLVDSPQQPQVGVLVAMEVFAVSVRHSSTIM